MITSNFFADRPGRLKTITPHSAVYTANSGTF